MMIGHKYVDCMDPSRTVVPTHSDGTCRVYFDGVLMGQTRISPKLFITDDVGGQLSRIGFVPKVKWVDDGEVEYDEEDH